MNTIEKSNAFVLNSYKRYPIVFDHGEGVYLYTDKGDRFLDMASGIAVSSLGHAHPAIIQAVSNQVKKLIHTSNLYYTKPYVDVAEKLVKNSIFDKVFFCNSGAEANEAALKIAKKYGNSIKKGKKVEIIAMKNSFHGRTIATLSVTGQTKYQKGFEPLLQPVKFAEYNNVNSLKKVISNKTAAVILEPIQGEGGVVPADISFLMAVRDLCDKYGALLIYDEVQTGIGRTGKLFAYEHFLPVEPDIVTIAKGLAGGFPIGVALLKEKYASFINPGEHASTFGGNLVSCEAANVVIDTILSADILTTVIENSKYFIDKVKALKERFKQIEDVRGIGYLIGVKFSSDAAVIVNGLIEEKVLTVPAGGNVVRFIPPLIAKKEHFDIAFNSLENFLKRM